MITDSNSYFSCPYLQCLCDILVDNAGVERLQLSSVDLRDEVGLLLASKLVPT